MRKWARLRSNQFNPSKQLLREPSVMELVLLVVIAWVAVIVALEGRPAAR